MSGVARKRDPEEKKRKPAPLGDVVTGYLKQSGLDERVASVLLEHGIEAGGTARGGPDLDVPVPVELDVPQQQPRIHERGDADLGIFMGRSA